MDGGAALLWKSDRKSDNTDVLSFIIHSSLKGRDLMCFFFSFLGRVIIVV